MNEMKPIPRNPDENRMVRNAITGAILLTSAGLLFVVVGLFIAEINSWKDYILLGAPAVLFMLGLLSIVLLRRGRIVLGTSIVFLANLIVPIVETSLQVNIGWAIFIYTLVSSVLLIWRSLPSASRRWAMVVASAALAVIVAIELIDSDIRIRPAAELITFIYVATALLFVAFIATAIQQAGAGSIRNRLLTAFIFLAALPVLLTGGASVLITSRNARDVALKEVAAIAQLKSHEISAWLSALQLSLTATLQDQITFGRLGIILTDQPATETTKPYVRKKFNEINQSLKYFDELFIIDTNGKIQVSTNEAQEGKIVKNQAYFQEGLKGAYITPPTYDVALSSYSIVFSQPIIKYGTTLGVIAGRANLNVVNGIMTEDSGLGKTNETYLVGSNYALLTQLRLTNEQVGTTYIRTDGVTKILESRTSGTSAYNDYRDAPVLGAYLWQPDLQVAIISEQDQSEALSASNQALATTVGLMVLTVLIASGAAFLITRTIANPISELVTVAERVTTGDLNATAATRSTDEIGVLANSFNSMTSRLRELIGSLEQRIAERTRNLELAAEVGRSVSQVRALDVMLTDAAELIRKQFDLYYVQVYLVNPSQTHLNLQAGTGHVGEQLLERSHRLPLDTDSINGRAAIEKKPVVISNTVESPAFKPNPLLPDTRSEMAIPLVVGDKVVGVLDMQSTRGGALDRDILPAFEALAGQIAIAIQNANFLAETQQARAEVEAQARRLVRANWREYLNAIDKPETEGFVFEKNQVVPTSQSVQPEVENSGALTAPIAITGEEVGNLIVEMEGESPIARTQELVNSVANLVAQHIESLRLLESAERYRAEMEEASRRTVREDWKKYAENAEELGYHYDLKEVRPMKDNAQKAETSAVPLKIREEVIGNLAVQGLDVSDKESFDLVNAVAERLSAHIESLRQSSQTQTALAQTQKLSDAGLLFTRAADLQEVVKIAVETLGISKINRAVLETFNYNSANEITGTDVIANWWNGNGLEPTAVGTHYTPETLPLLTGLFRTPSPVFIEDAFLDKRIDAVSIHIVRNLNIHAVAGLPLFIADRQIGILLLEADESHRFNEDEMRLFSAMAPQIATVLENRRQFERARQQAEREAMLNVIGQKIQSATTVEAVLQIAARELGHALGTPMTVAQLSMKDQE